MIISFGETDGDCEAMVLRGCTGYIVDVGLHAYEDDPFVFRIDRVDHSGLVVTLCTPEGALLRTNQERLTWDEIKSIYIN